MSSMKIGLRDIVLGLLLILGSGCGDGQSQKALIEDQVKSQVQSHEKLLKILKSVENRESMKSAVIALEQHAKEAEGLKDRGLGLSTPDLETLEKLRPYAEKLETLLKEQASELQRIKKLPDGDDFLTRLQLIRNQMQIDPGISGERMP